MVYIFKYLKEKYPAIEKVDVFTLQKFQVIKNESDLQAFQESISPAIAERWCRATVQAKVFAL